MEPPLLPLPGYDEVVPGRLYARPHQPALWSAGAPIFELLMLGRVRVVPPEDTYALFSSTARELLKASNLTRAPTSLDLSVCQLPRAVVATLADDTQSAKRLLSPLVAASETGRLRLGTEMLEVKCVLAPREATALIGHAFAPEHREDAVNRISCTSRAARGHRGHRWSVYLPLKRKAVPRPWMIVSGYQGPVDAFQPIEAPMLLEADERLAELHDSVGTSERLSHVADDTVQYTQAYHARIAEQLLARADRRLL